MATVLSKPLVRELLNYPGLIVTLTQDGITIKVKRRQRKIDIPWAAVIGAGAMTGDNKAILDKGAEVILAELGYNEYQETAEDAP